jgi:rhodanese-related sulfurtransferase
LNKSETVAVEFPMLPDPQAQIEVSPADVASWIQLPSQDRPRLIDCREREELEICQIAGNEWFPLSTLAETLDGLTSNTERGIVVYCHHGMRSQRAAMFLRSRGVENAFSMAGGIEAWTDQIDPSLNRY